MTWDGILVTIALLVLGSGILYAFGRGHISEKWRFWIMKASAAAGGALAIGMLMLGLPGAFFLEAVLGPGGGGLPSDYAWPLAIFITQFLALAILPASLLLRVVMPNAVGWGHAGATAVVTIVATFIFTLVIIGAYATT